MIGARGGSKRVPGKNLRIVGGRPLIEWTFDVARSSPSVSRVVLSTDDDGIAEVGKRAGIDVPFRRPADLSGDEATSEAFVLHTIDWLEAKEGYRPDAVMLLQPTSPLRRVEDVESALSLFKSQQADLVASVTRASGATKVLRRVTPEGRLSGWSEHTPMSESFVLNGAIYIARADVIRAGHGFIGANAFAYVMPSTRSLDIDDEQDMQAADAILRR